MQSLNRKQVEATTVHEGKKKVVTLDSFTMQSLQSLPIACIFEMIFFGGGGLMDFFDGRESYVPVLPTFSWSFASLSFVVWCGKCLFLFLLLLLLLLLEWWSHLMAAWTLLTPVLLSAAECWLRRLNGHCIVLYQKSLPAYQIVTFNPQKSYYVYILCFSFVFFWHSHWSNVHCKKELGNSQDLLSTTFHSNFSAFFLSFFLELYYVGYILEGWIKTSPYKTESVFLCFF